MNGEKQYHIIVRIQNFILVHGDTQYSNNSDSGSQFEKERLLMKCH